MILVLEFSPGQYKHSHRKHFQIKIRVSKSWHHFEITYYQTNLRITLTLTNRTLIFYTLNDSQIESSNYLKAILRLKLFLSQPQVISKMSQNYAWVVQNFIFILCAPKQPKLTSAVSLGIKSSRSEVWNKKSCNRLSLGINKTQSSQWPLNTGSKSWENRVILKLQSSK